MRRKLLIDARKAAGRTQEQVARLVGVDRTTLGKWERDESTPQPSQRSVYAEALGVTLDELDAMLSSVPQHSKQLPEWLTTYLGMEQSATMLRAHEPRAVYGLLQTPAYVEHLARGLCIPPVTDTYLRRTVDQRRYRQKRVHDGDLTLEVVQPESALHMRVGDAAVMAEQLGVMVELSELPNVTIRITTYDSGPYAARRLGDFVMMSHPWCAARVHIEGYSGGQFITNADEVEYFAAAFEHACRVALSPRQSREFLRELADTWRVRA
ncbi:helix-turn-helix transcriptional regulator [Nocardia sp. CC227C]|uniref:helix-turn-helix domain-containing protein n=1 Tax=Nocardia sp. CC227C TaxID=3044562 RepID=UPI00278BFEED|nr:helix-turn-helix transcriptional regulator [Nocardia sp. CC227C]